MPNAALDCKGHSTGDSDAGGRSPSPSDFPAFAIVVLNVPVGFRTVCRLQMFPVPVQFLSDPIGDVPQQRRFRQRSGVVERAGGRDTGFAGLDPFLVMAD